MHARMRRPRRCSLEAENEVPIVFRNGCDRQSITTTKDHHVLQLRGCMRAQLIERNTTFKGSFEWDVDCVPAWIRRIAVRIVVVIVLVERRLIGMRELRNRDDADDARHCRNPSDKKIPDRLFSSHRACNCAPDKLRTPSHEVVLRLAFARSSMPKVSGSDLNNQ